MKKEVNMKNYNKKKLDKRRIKNPVTYQENKILNWIKVCGWISIREITNFLNLPHNANVSNKITALHRKGKIEKWINKKDKRDVKYTIKDER